MFSAIWIGEQCRIVASLEFEHEYQPDEDGEYNQGEKKDEKMSTAYRLALSKPSSIAHRLTRSQELHKERMRLKTKQAIDDDIRRLRRQAIDEEDGKVNLVETKEASCNTTPVESTRSFKMGTDPVYTHNALNHRDTEVIIRTLETSSKEYNKISRLDKNIFKEECKEATSQCRPCLTVSNRRKAMRRKWSI